MAPDRYAGDAGQKLLREEEAARSSSALQEAHQARRDLLLRLPSGRALDQEDLASMIDETNQTSRAIGLRRRLLEEIRRNLPGGILVSSGELEALKVYAKDHPTQPGAWPGLAEWPSSR